MTNVLLRRGHRNRIDHVKRKAEVGVMHHKPITTKSGEGKEKFSLELSRGHILADILISHSWFPKL